MKYKICHNWDGESVNRIYTVSQLEWRGDHYNWKLHSNVNPDLIIDKFKLKTARRIINSIKDHSGYVINLKILEY